MLSYWDSAATTVAYNLMPWHDMMISWIYVFAIFSLCCLLTNTVLTICSSDVSLTGQNYVVNNCLSVQHVVCIVSNGGIW